VLVHRTPAPVPGACETAAGATCNGDGTCTYPAEADGTPCTDGVCVTGECVPDSDGRDGGTGFPAGGGCGCRVGGDSSDSAFVFLFAGLMLIAARRRRWFS